MPDKVCICSEALCALIRVSTLNAASYVLSSLLHVCGAQSSSEECIKAPIAAKGLSSGASPAPCRPNMVRKNG
jgi:hypothetical protein